MIVKAQDVRVGDHIYNSSAKHPAFQWCRVSAVEKTTTRVRLEHGGEATVEAYRIETSGWYTVKTRNEGVGIVRT
jgi:hypothetical protein